MHTSIRFRALSFAFAALLAVSFVPRTAHAITPPLINGTIDFGGVVTFDTLSLATATRVNAWNVSFVLQDSGDFASIPAGTSVSMMAPWIFTPTTITPGLWSVGGFTFDLTSSVVVQQTANFLNISGVGTISGAGFAPTPGFWSFTSSNGSGQDRGTFGFQADSSAVPEPASLALLGMGAAGLVALRVRRGR